MSTGWHVLGCTTREDLAAERRSIALSILINFYPSHIFAHVFFFLKLFFLLTKGLSSDSVSSFSLTKVFGALEVQVIEQPSIEEK